MANADRIAPKIAYRASKIGENEAKKLNSLGATSERKAASAV